MPQPRRYETQAEKQKAYRVRLAAHHAAIQAELATVKAHLTTTPAAAVAPGRRDTSDGEDPAQSEGDTYAAGYAGCEEDNRERWTFEGYSAGYDAKEREMTDAGYQQLGDLERRILEDKGVVLEPDTLEKALQHYAACPHRHQSTHVALTNAELRAAKDPFQALRDEYTRVYEADIRSDLEALIALAGCSRSTYAPGILAMHAKRLDAFLRTLPKLLAPGKRNETLERWQGETGRESSRDASGA
jgi:hypothetical protein